MHNLSHRFIGFRGFGISGAGFRSLAVGCSLAALALACGGGDGGGEGSEPIAPPAPQGPVRETCADNPLLAGCEEELPEADNGGNPVDVTDDEPVDVTDPAELARAQAQNVLESNCGACHGPALTQDQAEAGMNYINDIDRLVETGKITPLDSAGSLIIRRMRAGEMPPAASGRPQVSPAEIDIVAQFIDNPRFWPDVEVSAQPCFDQRSSFDDLYVAVANDLSSLDADDALTARYLSLANRVNAGVCIGDSLERDRQALFKLVNMLSTATTVEEPVAVDADETLFRIDLADYGWDQPVSVVNADGSVTNFTDKWEAILANNPYAISYVGDDADDAVIDSNTTVPVMLADSLLDTASIGNLYYALIGVDVQDTLDNFILNQLQIDVAQNLLDQEQVRAGTTRSRISRQDRMVQRDEIEVRQGVLWQSFDFENDVQNESIFEDPFGFAEGGTEAIFTLPNGLFGFVIADANSTIVEDSDILLDTSQNNFRAVTSISCSNCHSQGLIPVVDEVRDVALANAIVSGLDNDEIEQLEEVFPDAAEFARIVEADSNGFFRRALASTSVPLQGGDPVSSVFFRFDQDLTLADAAGDLGITPDELEGGLNLFDPALQVLDGGTLDRDDFTQFYLVSLCGVSVVNENQPDPNLCAAALALQ